MRKTLNGMLLLALFALFTTSVLAQSHDEYNRFEGFAGYSFNNVDTGLKSSDLDPSFNDSIDKRFRTNGLNISFAENFHKYIGAKFDYSYHQRTETDTFDGESFTAGYRVHQFLGGLQFKDNRSDGARFKPFGHVLAGVARQKIALSGSGVDSELGVADISFVTNDFAMAFGGGLDVKVTKHVDIRVFQADYNPIFLRGRTIDDVRFDGRTQNNVRLSFGIVFH